MEISYATLPVFQIVLSEEKAYSTRREQKVLKKIIVVIKNKELL